jgi:GWxTD domain-containing protein
VVLSSVLTLQAAAATWLERVEPIISPAEKKAYLALNPEARQDFESRFWTNKAITAEEYFARLAHIDAAFGSGRPTSGANTDQGRVHLSIGPPVRITRIPSSRIFVPLEIWYYDAVPGVLDTELRLIFFQKNNTGFPELYSPEANTIRALLLPQASTRNLFRPNDSISESDIRQKLNVGPAEDEIITAAMNVATGIRGSGNEEILGRVSSPIEMISRPPRTRVTSRLIPARPKMDVLETPSPFGGWQIDLRLETTVEHQLDIEVAQGAVIIYQNQLHLDFSKAEPVVYTHRLDLLPGSYRVLFAVDGKSFPYMVEPASDIQRADWGNDVSGRETPFEFDGRQLELNPEGKIAVVPLAQAGKATWMIRRGAEVVWRSVSEARQLATVELPVAGLPPGTYQLEAVTQSDSRSTEFVVRRNAAPRRSQATLVSFNANLKPAQRLAFIGHQWLLRGKQQEARQSLALSLKYGITEEAQIELARADALAGNLDDARDRVRSLLALHPDSFEALAVFAYIETRLQDFAVAADLYRRALALQDSPDVRAALANLPGEQVQ